MFGRRRSGFAAAVLSGVALTCGACSSTSPAAPTPSPTPTAASVAPTQATTATATVATTPTATTTSTPSPTPVQPTPTPAQAPPPGAAAALIAAARRGDIAEVQRLLATGASVTTSDAAGETALIAAAYGKHLEVAEALIAAGADVNTQDRTRQSAYLIATSEIGGDARALAFLRLTLRNGADVRSLDSYNGTGLIRAADRGYLDIVRDLLTTDIDIDHVNRLGWTALLEAIILGGGDAAHTEVVTLLVDAGADVNLADGAGVSPLQHAASRGYAGMTAILRAAGGR